MEVVYLKFKMTKKKTIKTDSGRGEAGAFTRELLIWNQLANNRMMPWKGESDPYKIWLSEIILQQTRVEQGLKYYDRFIESFPTIKDLAAAPEQEVFKLWEGLGYYSRCRNLLATARYVAQERRGVFPDSYEEILELKGVGPYTAAAIASFAYNLPFAVLDGNVFRVLSRIYAEPSPIDSTEGKKLFAQLAEDLLPFKKAGEYNQAIMDFGATICKPLPECARCFFNDRCLAFLSGKQKSLPVKSKSIAVKERWFHYFLLSYKGKIAIRKRIASDIWQDLFEYLLLESTGPVAEVEWKEDLEREYNLPQEQFSIVEKTINQKQRLSHQLIHFSFTILSLKAKPSLKGFQWVPSNKLHQYPFPQTLKAYTEKNIA